MTPAVVMAGSPTLVRRTLPELPADLDLLRADSSAGVLIAWPWIDAARTRAPLDDLDLRAA